jgi:hypothetical protein
MEDEFIKMTYPERKVAIYLKNMNIEWTYEQPVFVWDENKRPRVWTPDFYLKYFGIYIEVCGSEKFDYEYRKKIFDINGYRVIFLHLYKETKKWEDHFLNYLLLFVNYENKKFNKLLKKRN